MVLLFHGNDPKEANAELFLHWKKKKCVTGVPALITPQAVIW